ncbi:hypothetical protein HPB51_000056 [Rhipicephalus microplus]|uniref:Uncharacterized protein n=1 Tax=Rhipicephalus microplus TaxID=6941 RepID=A0A9J6EDZ2_RHIMP|nr:hypothetical protein HPB51_000056 [Rhipicephalus microplus]
MSCQTEGPKKDFGDDFPSELCEDGPDLTPRTRDKFASAIVMQDTLVTESEDVVVGSSRRLRMAVGWVRRESTGGVCSLSFGGDVTTPWLPRSPAFDDCHIKECLPLMCD